MSTISASGRQVSSRTDAQRLLDDPQWLRASYELDGDKVIARRLGVSHMRVAEARLRHGIASLPPGRRRGQPARPRTDQPQHQPTLLQILERVAYDTETGELPTWGAALAQFAAGDRARQVHDRTSERNAALALAAAAIRLAEHLERVQEAA